LKKPGPGAIFWSWLLNKDTHTSGTSVRLAPRKMRIMISFFGSSGMLSGPFRKHRPLRPSANNMDLGLLGCQIQLAIAHRRARSWREALKWQKTNRSSPLGQEVSHE